jgi:outer membrane protein assembly factor BamB
VGGDCITGHDAATGRELWRWGTWNPTRIGHWRLVPSPVAGKGVALACAPKASPVFAVKTGGSGILPESFVAWKSDPSSGVTSDVPTPLFYMDDFFILSDLKKTLARVEPATGKIKWSIKTPGNAKYEASPTGADGRIFLMNFKGDVVIADAQRGEVLQNIQMGDPGDDQIRSTIAVSQGQLFIRTNRRLYCVGQ